MKSILRAKKGENEGSWKGFINGSGFNRAPEEEDYFCTHKREKKAVKDQGEACQRRKNSRV